MKKNINQFIIILIEPFFSGSHKSWAEGYKNNSEYFINIISLKGIYWKWRMHGGALSLAKKYNNYIKNHGNPDLILVTDMLNLPLFTSFADVKNIPIISFFHENQLTYPWSTQDRDKEKNRDHHYGFINYTTALRSNKVMFNSNFHKEVFLNALRKFLMQFPDNKELSNVDNIINKSVTSYLGLDLIKFNSLKKENNNKIPIILWNHRWEYDKNPEDFFKCLYKIKKEKINFKLVILGEQFNTEMEIFNWARKTFYKEIIHIGYCESFNEYANWLWKSDIIPVTTNQDFFGASIMEAVYCNVHPLLPDRLTYPELFDINKNKNNFYKNNSELEIKLRELLINFNKSELKSLNNYANQYDWTIIAKQYDSIIKNTINNY